jgi:hypothetical protein
MKGYVIGGKNGTELKARIRPEGCKRRSVTAKKETEMFIIWLTGRPSRVCAMA